MLAARLAVTALLPSPGYLADGQSRMADGQHRVRTPPPLRYDRLRRTDDYADACLTVTPIEGMTRPFGITATGSADFLGPRADEPDYGARGRLWSILGWHPQVAPWMSRRACSGTARQEERQRKIRISCH